METLCLFEQTEMYQLLKNLNDILNLNYNLNNFRLSSPFWMGDEHSYSCFLSVLQSEYYSVTTQRLTRSKKCEIKITLDVVKDIVKMLIEYIPDDKVEASIDSRCVVCLFNKPKTPLKCGHFSTCQKCLNVLHLRGVFNCPLCRQ
ncbi:putative RING finger protein [Invertebrate iridovirus 25]|uniref:Putative RING finger protein n=1 Tax=Invertebrate iridovirus 25 TaxID=1301280 RepID=W8W224_9VIRU|nr:putative RING finger protein [Invertebrate iridovirus 25]CCV02086.1 putative RING finger protein [Invertebrate iridovirus 25]